MVLCGTFLVATTQSFPSIFCIAVGCRIMFVRVDSFVELLSCSNRSESILQSKTCPSTSGSLVPSPALHSNLSFASVRKMRDACMYEYVMRFCGRAGAHACVCVSTEEACCPSTHSRIQEGDDRAQTSFPGVSLAGSHRLRTETVQTESTLVQTDAEAMLLCDHLSQRSALPGK